MKKLVGPFDQVVTLEDAPLKGSLKNESLGIKTDCGILLNNETIESVGSFDQMAPSADQIEELSGNNVAFPGFIDCHTHLIWGGSRAADFERRNSGFTYQQILNEGGGILDTVGKTRNSSNEILRTGLKTRLKRHLKDGVTTTEIKSGYGLSPEHEINLLRIISEERKSSVMDIIPTFLGAHVSPADLDKYEYLEKLTEEVFPIIVKEDLSRRVDAFVEKEAFPKDVVRDYLLRAIQKGFRITLHAGQFSPEGVHLACELGAISADHLETIGEKEINMLSKSNIVPVALPGASIGLGMAFTPARKLLNAGCGLAIATDWNPGSAPSGDLLMQASLLSTYEKLSSAEVFAGITFRSAAALGLMDRGKITSGQLADLAIFHTNDYREVLYQMGSMKPSIVYKKGKRV